MKKGVLLPILTIVLAAAVLFGAAFGLSGVTKANTQKDHIRLLKTLLPGSTEFTAEPYAGEDATIRSVHKGEGGFVIETVSYGYAGNITVLVGVNNDGKVTGIVVDDLQETFGLGAQGLTDVEFLAQFLNGAGGFSVETGSPDTYSGATGTATETDGDSVAVDAITGATVTSKAIARSVNAAVAYVTGADTESAATSWGG